MFTNSQAAATIKSTKLVSQQNSITSNIKCQGELGFHILLEFNLVTARSQIQDRLLTTASITTSSIKIQTNQVT